MESQRVVVIQDASKEVCLSAIKWIIQGFSLKPGDSLTIISVLHQVINPSTLSFTAARKTMGYKSRIDSSMFGANHKVVRDEVAKKNKEYQENTQLNQISILYQNHKVEFKMEVNAGASPKIVGIEAAKRLNATWVILDRQMKKEKKMFLEKLACGISRMKHDNNIEQLRGPKPVKISRIISRKITYDEMLPGSPESDDDLFSIELFPKMSTSCMGSHESTSISSFSEEKFIPNLKVKSEIIVKVTRAENQPSDENFNKEETKDLIGSSKLEEVLSDSVCSICKNKRPISESKRSFSYQEILDATNEFSTENKIFEGGYCDIFKGELIDKSTIVVKRQSKKVFQAENKFESEQKILEKISYKNIVIILGSCSEKSHRLLVYEFICNGSLRNHLSNRGSNSLTWRERLRIAFGAARGLNYLHQNNIIHRDIRPDNILVTHDYEPVLSGFGLARTQDEPKLFVDQCFTGTYGYLAPEYAESGKASTKSDVYSFGVVLLELITCRSTTDTKLEEKSLLGWARPLFKERNYSELIDPKTVEAKDGYKFILMVQLVEKCLTRNPVKRFSMVEVLSALEQIMEEKSWCEIDEILLHKSNEMQKDYGETNTYHTNANTSSSSSATNELRRKSNFSPSSKSSSPPSRQQSFKRTRPKSILSYEKLLN